MSSLGNPLARTLITLSTVESHASIGWKKLYVVTVAFVFISYYIMSKCINFNWVHCYACIMLSIYLHVIKGLHGKTSRSKIFALWALHESLTWRKRGAGDGGWGVRKRLQTTFIMKSGGSCWSNYTMMAGVLANFGPNSQTILPV